MEGFQIRTPQQQVIRFRFYQKDAPLTSAAFAQSLPFTQNWLHARVSGEEIWIDDAPQLDVIQENSSVFPREGEVVIGPIKPKRNKVSGCMGIFYGEGKGLDGSNIFACVVDEDLALLKQLGQNIWKNGAQSIIVERIP